jgi:hypothetical protein
MSEDRRAYGEGRVRLNVSYGEVERAAIAILKSERRPTVEDVLERLPTQAASRLDELLPHCWPL